MRGALQLLCVLAAAPVAPAQPPAQLTVPTALVRGFDQGPTRWASLVAGSGTGLHFRVSLDGADAQALFDQGMMQLHGLAHYQAECSFRQVAALEPNCAMAWWGVALANVAHPDRATHFVAEALRRRHHATAREREFIDALAGFYEVSEVREKQPETDALAPVYDLRKRSFDRSLAERSQKLLAAWEAILVKAPDDIEVMALVVRQIWLNSMSGTRDQEKARRYLARILQKSPRHPAHFYRLFLDVVGDLRGALESVGAAGHAPSNPGPWWASGRLLLSLHRHEDALEYFEAALRTAHAYLQRERAMPCLIADYGDAAAGYVRCLMYLGRVQAAQECVEHLLSLPRHPRLNRLEDPRSIAGQAQACQQELRDEFRPGKATVDALKKEVAARPNRVATMARLLDAYIRAGDRGRAAALLQALRRVGGRADLDLPLLEPAHDLARDLGLPKDWRQPRNRAADWPRDLGPLPHLEVLGPLRWTPPTPFGWSLPDAAGQETRLRDYRGKPVVVVLHLGFG